MWTEITRPQYRRDGLCYASDTTEAEWAVIDSQSVKTTESAGPRGAACPRARQSRDPWNAAKKVKGRKRHILTDTTGLLVAAIVHAADVQDRDGAPLLLGSIRSAFPWLRHVFADSADAAAKLTAALARRGKWTLEIVKRCDAAKASSSCRGVGSSSARSLGSTEIAASPRTSKPPSRAPKPGS